jgi:hypothetical protein
LAEQLEEGCLICVEFKANQTEKEFSALACVVHSTPLPDGCFEHGCTFSAELDESDLSHFGARKEREKGSDQRTWKRFSTQGEVRFKQVLLEEESLQSGKITNISASGVGLIVAESIDPGTVLRLELRRDKNSPAISMMACVVYLSEQSQAGWLIGCNFIHELSSHDLEALL